MWSGQNDFAIRFSCNHFGLGWIARVKWIVGRPFSMVSWFAAIWWVRHYLAFCFTVFLRKNVEWTALEERGSVSFRTEGSHAHYPVWKIQVPLSSGFLSRNTGPSVHRGLLLLTLPCSYWDSRNRYKQRCSDYCCHSEHHMGLWHRSPVSSASIHDTVAANLLALRESTISDPS